MAPRPTGSGNYIIQDLPEGTYYVNTNNTAPPCELLTYVDKWWDGNGGTIDCNQAAPVAVATAGDTSGINFALAQGGTISGASNE